MTTSEITKKVTIKSYDPILQFEEVKKIWTGLLAKCPHSFFLSWGWKEVWLKSLPKNCNLSLMVGFKDKKPIFAYFIGSQKFFRYGVIRTHQISLNSTVDKSTDVLSIEYNSILLDSEINMSLETLISLMPIKNWDEFCFPNIAPRSFLNFELNVNFSVNYNVSRKSTLSHYVDLKKVREADMDYLYLLSSRRRRLLGRSLKEYEKLGKVQAIAAGTADEALLMLEELKKLHQKTWVKRGKPGAFSSDYFYKFHRGLIANRFKNNEVQLIHVTCGQDTIGYLYSFLFNGRVLGYQGGFNYLPQSVYLPGMTCHYLAVIINAAKGLDTYDFLEGDAPYKKTLSTDYSEMQNIMVQKKRVRFSIENKLRQIYRSTRKVMRGECEQGV